MGIGETESYTENGYTYNRYIYAPAHYDDGGELYYDKIEEYDPESYMSAEWLDIDNDGKLELYLPTYLCGGVMLDARDGKVYVLAEGEGSAVWLSYTFWNGKYWIVHSDTSYVGRELYYLKEYCGPDVVNEVSLTAEYWESENSQYDENSVFAYNDEAITMEEFERLRMEIFGR